MNRPIRASVEFVGGPFCGKHDVITVTDGLPRAIGLYQSTGQLTREHRRARYDYQHEHTGRRLPPTCDHQPFPGCPRWGRKADAT